MKKIFLVISSLFTWFFGGLYLILWCLTLILSSLFLPIKIYDPILKYGCKFMVFIVRVHRNVQGVEKLDRKQRYIFMANHTNLLDTFVIYASFPHIGRGIEKASHFKWPFYGWALKAVQMIPIPSERGSGRSKSIYQAMDKAIKFIKKKKHLSIVIMPEGTRTRDGKIGRFKRGGFIIAIETGIPIVPMTINGLFEIQQKGGFLLNPGEVEVIFHDPVKTEGLKREDAAELMQKVQEIIKSKHNLELN
ncbi:MAG: 1-acyl-sn-glycerol-3-phosphate acyltransferase [Acidobacteria bacterium]|nr:1-acyl-sn-glycerol-3-phosphate acyltransferase [Acidobacteriota bacterium]